VRKNLLCASLLLLLVFSLLCVNVIRIAIAQADHDIAVTSVTPSPTSLKAGELVNITVVVENQGMKSETFNVTTFYDDTAIDTQNVADLASGANTTLTFSWNTTSLFYNLSWHLGTYTVRAAANIVPNETDTEDNTLVSLSKIRVFKSPYVGVVPHCTVDPNLTIGTTYTVAIYTDYNGSDITGWQFTLEYNPHVLHGVEVTNGDLITNATHPDKARFLLGTFDNTAGKLSLTGAHFFFVSEPAPLTSGPGTLANVTFEVVGIGDSDITLGTLTKLIGYTEGGYGEYDEIVSNLKPDIKHLLHGSFRNTVAEVIHDVAVTSVALSRTSVKLGGLVNITVVVENQGTAVEAFQVMIHRSIDQINWWHIGTKPVQALAIGGNVSLTFTWNTTNVSTGAHTIKAVTSTIDGEEDTDDNTCFSDDTVTVTRPQTSLGLPIEFVIIAIAVIIITVGAVSVYTVKRRHTRAPRIDVATQIKELVLITQHTHSPRISWFGL